MAGIATETSYNKSLYEVRNFRRPAWPSRAVTEINRPAVRVINFVRDTSLSMRTSHRRREFPNRAEWRRGETSSGSGRKNEQSLNLLTVKRKKSVIIIVPAGGNPTPGYRFSFLRHFYYDSKRRSTIIFLSISTNCSRFPLIDLPGKGAEFSGKAGRNEGRVQHYPWTGQNGSATSRLPAVSPRDHSRNRHCFRIGNRSHDFFCTNDKQYDNGTITSGPQFTYKIYQI